MFRAVGLVSSTFLRHARMAFTLGTEAGFTLSQIDTETDTDTCFCKHHLALNHIHCKFFLSNYLQIYLKIFSVTGSDQINLLQYNVYFFFSPRTDHIKPIKPSASSSLFWLMILNQVLSHLFTSADYKTIFFFYNL